MQEFLTKVTSNGRITVPVDVRRSLGLKPGDKVAVAVPEPGSRVVIIRPATSAEGPTTDFVPPRVDTTGTGD